MNSGLSTVRPENLGAVESGASGRSSGSKGVSKEELEDMKRKGEERELGTDEEAKIAKGLTRVCMPSKKEWDDHWKLHIPFRAWCPMCVAGKAVNHNLTHHTHQIVRKSLK